MSSSTPPSLAGQGAVRLLHVFIDQTRVATLSEENNIWVLEYDSAWSSRDDSFDLSPALPRTTARHVDGATLRPVQWYFDNLLPEEEMRSLVAKDAGLRDKDDAFALLEYLGAESAGSLTLLPPGDALPQEHALQPLPYLELSRRIEQLPTSSLSREAPKRMSVAGAQHKLLAVLKGADVYEPVGATPSTHVLKPDHPHKQTYPASTFLEYLTMRMADAAGLDVPEVELLQVPQPVYAIKRFDRVVRKGGLGAKTGDAAPVVRRRHVIDACQLLNKSRVFKHSGASVDALREVIERTGNTLTLPQRMFRWLVFNLLVANDDCHLKNLSFLVEPNSITLAPHYDLLATGVYHTRAFADADARWPYVNMAVRLSDEVLLFSDVTPAAVLEAAQTLGVPAPVAVRVAREVVTRTLRYFDEVYAEHYPGEPGLLVWFQSQYGSAAGKSSTVKLAGLDATADGREDATSAGTSDAPQGSAVSGRAQNPLQLGVQRKILRVLRYVVLPDMAPRLTLS